MKIGEFVKLHIKAIFDGINAEELSRLMDQKYSKRNFDINFPFCIDSSGTARPSRYWADRYHAHGKTVRVTSEWFNPPTSNSASMFRDYLQKHKIKIESDENTDLGPVGRTVANHQRMQNARYRKTEAGDAQNMLIRHILGKLGQESFNRRDWENTQAFFSHRCVYCDGDGKLIMDHAVPINRKSLGEHRLGNLVPSCRKCNAEKGNADFRDFLRDKDNGEERIRKIAAYMKSAGYTPLGDDENVDGEQIKRILEIAYREVSFVADRYIAILNEILPRK